MKKQKQVKQFEFKNLSKEQVSDQINVDLPISLRYNEDLINRIYNRYPLLDKAEIGLIVKAIFSSMRELLIRGMVLNFNKLFFDTKLFFFMHVRNGVIFPSVKVEMTTPPKLKRKQK